MTFLELSQLTTLRVGGRAEVVSAHTADQVAQLVAAADDAGRQILVLGGGSNLVISDASFDGIVIRPELTELSVSDDGVATAGAGVAWDDLVALCVKRGLSGIEALSGIPGSVGAAPVQNIGAYGQEVGETIDSVLVWDRELREMRELGRDDLRLGYRSSVLKDSMLTAGSPWFPSPRQVVVSVRLRLVRSELSAPVRYRELAEWLGVAVGERAALAEVRAAVLHLRRGKGMVLDGADHDTWSAGSFFTNPILSAFW